MSSSSMLFEHTQRFVRAIFANRLQQEGFSSYKREDIHWYRLVNNEVVQSVYFVTRHHTLQSSFEICYGCHPLYIPPIFRKSPYMYALPGYEQMNDAVPETIVGSTSRGFEKLHLIGMYNRPYRIPDILIPCPQDKNNGLDVLEKLLPVMSGMSTPYACYEMHKKRREQEISNGNTFFMSSYFVDEVLFWEDQNLYPYCQEYVANQTWCLGNFSKEGVHIGKETKQHFERCTILNRVFEEGSFCEYLQTFPERAQETLHLLEKNAGIQREV